MLWHAGLHCGVLLLASAELISCSTVLRMCCTAGCCMAQAVAPAACKQPHPSAQPNHHPLLNPPPHPPPSPPLQRPRHPHAGGGLRPAAQAQRRHPGLRLPVRETCCIQPNPIRLRGRACSQPAARWLPLARASASRTSQGALEGAPHPNSLGSLHPDLACRRSPPE